MILNMLKSKIHRATITDANLNYQGSITIDSDLMEAAGILENEQVHVVDVNNGNRLVTYAIRGVKGSGTICLNGAAARLVHTADKIIILAYCQIDKTKAKNFKPKLIFVDENNKVQ